MVVFEFQFIFRFTLKLQTCFFRQFGRSVVRADYLTLRKGFIMVQTILMCQIDMMNMSPYGFIYGNVSGLKFLKHCSSKID